MSIHDDIDRVIIAEDEIARRVAELGQEISERYAACGRPPLLVAVLRGASLFVADLVRAIEVPVELDFMAVSSYGSTTKSSGVVRILKDLDEDIEGRDVLVVEDILTPGLRSNTSCATSLPASPRALRWSRCLRRKASNRCPSNARMLDSPCLTSSWWGTDWIMPSGIGTCRISGY